MTANRWWVRLFARWVARIDSVQGQLNLFFTALSGVSLAAGVLGYFGTPLWAIGGALTLMFVALAGYTYYFSEGGVWNQKQRDVRDMSNNFAGPNARIVNEMEVRAMLAAFKGRQLTEEERENIASELDSAFFELRDGVSLEEKRT